MKEGRTKAYHRIKTVLFFARIFSFAAVLFYMLAGGVWRAVAGKISAQGAGILTSSAAFLVFFLILSLLEFPFSWAESYWVEKKFSLSNQKFFGWLGDFIKEQLVSGILFLIVVNVVYFALKHSYALWWLKAWVFWFFLNFILVKIYPYVILPLFFRFSLLDNKDLSAVIKKLFLQAKMKLDKIWVVNLSRKTKKANAFVTGLGKNRRLVLADNLINHYTFPQIAATVAHELGHIKHKDALLIFFVEGLGSLAAFFASAKITYKATDFFSLGHVYNISTLPLFLLVFGAVFFVASPFLNVFLRWREKLADKFALDTTQDKEAFISLMRQLAADNLAEGNPPRWKVILFYTHPPIKERIVFAQKWNAAAT